MNLLHKIAWDFVSALFLGVLMAGSIGAHLLPSDR